jgi:hypothetical protein
VRSLFAILGLIFVGSTVGCSYLLGQAQHTATDDCKRRQCGAELDGLARERCEAQCRREYGK